MRRTNYIVFIIIGVIGTYLDQFLNFQFFRFSDFT